MKIVFMGTPDFAVPCLQKLIDDGHEIVGVFSQPDKPKGRGYVLAPTPVKKLALKYQLPVFQPEKMRDGVALDILKKLQPELIVVVAYGKILPKEILDLPAKGCINVHGSLLPKYRGAAPIQWAVLNGDKKTGVTTMFMDVGMDTGDILEQSETEIGEQESAGELFDRLCYLGADLLSATLHHLQEGVLQRHPQNDAEATYAPMLDKEMSLLDWSRSAWELHNQVRGLSPWPSAFTLLGEKKLKVHQTLLGGKTSAAAGSVISVTPFTVACGDGNALILKEIQYEGGKRMASADFLRGHTILPGTILG